MNSPPGSRMTVEFQDGRKAHLNTPVPGMVRLEQLDGRTEDMTLDEFRRRERERRQLQ